MPEAGRNARWREWVLGAAFVAIAFFASVIAMGQAVRPLGLGLVIAWGFWARTRWVNDPGRVLPLYLLGLSVQCLHFCEEYLTGFARAFPRLFGYKWSERNFVAFNLLWLALFVLAALGVFFKMRVAYLLVFFYALVGGIGNGILHLALSLVEGRYFPGTITAPAHVVVGVLLLRRLYTHAESS